MKFRNQMLRYSYSEAAEILGISKSKVQRRVREGRLTPVYDGAQPRLTHEEVVRYAKSNTPQLEKYVKNGTRA